MDSVQIGALIVIAVVTIPTAIYVISQLWEYGKLKARQKFKQKEKEHDRKPT